MGTSALRPVRAGWNETGLMQNCQIVGSRDLGTIDAFRIVARNWTVVDPVTNAVTVIPLTSTAFPMRIAFGNSIGTIRTRDSVDGLNVTTGLLKDVSIGDTQRASISAARIRKVVSSSNLRGTTTINATAPDSQIDLISTKRAMFATINSNQSIQTISVGTDLGSSTVNVNRNLQNLTVNGSILSDSTVRVGATLSKLTIGGDLQEDAVVIASKINKQVVKGQVIGDIIIA
jgi:hypothetical protein